MKLYDGSKYLKLITKSKKHTYVIKINKEICEMLNHYYY